MLSLRLGISESSFFIIIIISPEGTAKDRTTFGSFNNLKLLSTNSIFLPMPNWSATLLSCLFLHSVAHRRILSLNIVWNIGFVSSALNPSLGNPAEETYYSISSQFLQQLRYVLLSGSIWPSCIEVTFLGRPRLLLPWTLLSFPCAL